MHGKRKMLRAARQQIRHAVASRSGNVATMFAIVAIPLIGLVGAAIDYSNGYRAKSRIQNALDATALAVNRSIGQIPEQELREMAKATFISNVGDNFSANLSEIEISMDDREVTLAASGQVDTYFISLLGIDRMPVTASSTTITGQQTFEIALVLDNSGSMYGRKISDLKDAARGLTDIMFAGQSVSDIVKISVVPFAGSVNVGAQHRNSSWMDRNAVSPVHSENFIEDANRFELFDRFSNTGWQGCVESRPQPHDVEDTSPDPTVPESYFVPMFAPDEPDSENDDGQTVYNNYIDDGVEPAREERRRGRRGRGGGGGGGSGGDDPTWDEAQGNIDKYTSGVRADIRSSNSTHTGPNYMCESEPITPLTNNKRTITSALNDMSAYGLTNIHEGTMWGWRTLSAKAPFSQGVPDNTENNHKIIVLMTDGANTHRGANSENKSIYSPYGFARNARLRPPTHSTSALVEMMDERTQRACRNAKNAGIIVYTIGFELHDGETRNLLKNCASDKNKAYIADNGSELIATFDNIAKELSALRILR